LRKALCPVQSTCINWKPSRKIARLRPRSFTANENTQEASAIAALKQCHQISRSVLGFSVWKSQFGPLSNKDLTETMCLPLNGIYLDALPFMASNEQLCTNLSISRVVGSTSNNFAIRATALSGSSENCSSGRSGRLVDSGGQTMSWCCRQYDKRIINYLVWGNQNARKLDGAPPMQSAQAPHRLCICCFGNR